MFGPRGLKKEGMRRLGEGRRVGVYAAFLPR
jgi:hypothetical protein